jgi:ABC-type multidrug transport system fused ATPase/permease subunit
MHGVLSVSTSLCCRNASFSYPGAQSSDTKVLRDINLAIAPGQLVVLVGVNGSGKSTLLNLLMRLYDVSEGQLLINSLPIKEYTRASLQQATALLGQEHNIFPLSLYENIALGCHTRMDDKELVDESMKKGGASFVKEMELGLDTILEPVETGRGNNIHDPNDPIQVALKAKLKEMEKKVDISGGQRQRIVASRTFMRFHSGKVRLVAADEPSSALDPEGELELFKNLIAARAGKTMIFVTHRFGHLTRHADLIVCMKEGRIVEKGTHRELMTLDGEYAGLYNVQASAFVEN